MHVCAYTCKGWSIVYSNTVHAKTLEKIKCNQTYGCTECMVVGYWNLHICDDSCTTKLQNLITMISMLCTTGVALLNILWHACFGKSLLTHMYSITHPQLMHSYIAILLYSNYNEWVRILNECNKWIAVQKYQKIQYSYKLAISWIKHVLFYTQKNYKICVTGETCSNYARIYKMLQSINCCLS